MPPDDGEDTLHATAIVESGPTQIVPPVQAPPTKWWGLFSRERDERKQFEKDGSQSHNVRRIAAYGGVIFVGVLYLAGLVAVALVLGLVPGYDRVDAGMWHIIVAILVALFTVPTVLLIAILKVTSPAQVTELPPTLHEAISKLVEKGIDKICG